MIRNIIFDLAGVLLNLDIEADTKALVYVGLPDFDGCLQRTEISHPIMLYLNGLCTKQTFLTNIRPFCRPDAKDDEIMAAMDAVLDTLPKSRLEALVQLRQNYKVFLLSNLYDKAWDYTRKQFEEAGFTTEQCFDQTFISYEMQLAKPDPRIYHAVFEQTGILPEETIYFDDTRVNIEAGKKLGLTTCLVPMNHLEECEEYQSLFITK